MKPTKTMTYALACLKELAKQLGEFVQVAEIARNQGLPAAYCQKILLALSRAGLVESVKGRGFSLLKPVEQMTTLEVVNALYAAENPEEKDDHCEISRLINEILTARMNRAFAELSVAEAVKA